MGMIGLVAGAMFAIFVAVLSRLFAEEVKAWLPLIIERRLMRAVYRLPEDQRKRMEEEWRADLVEWPGELSRLWRAIDYSRAAGKVSLAEGGSWLRAIAPGQRRLRRFDVHFNLIQLGALGFMSIYGSYNLLFAHLDKMHHSLAMSTTLPAIPSFLWMLSAILFQAYSRRHRERELAEPRVK